MLKLFVSVPIACFRPGAAREFWETHPLPPPSTVYGFLLAMVGEVDRERHIGVRCSAGLLNQPDRSTVLRKLWRVKELKKNEDKTDDFSGAGVGANVRPDFQNLLTNVRLVVFVESGEETIGGDSLEDRLKVALDPKQRQQISRFGGLSLGESTHMVDEVSLFERRSQNPNDEPPRVFLSEDQGNMTLPVWVDHIGREGTRYATGRLTVLKDELPSITQIPQIDNGSFERLKMGGSQL
jgi:CRISPR-associated protein Cas5t